MHFMNFLTGPALPDRLDSGQWPCAQMRRINFPSIWQAKQATFVDFLATHTISLTSLFSFLLKPPSLSLPNCL